MKFWTFVPVLALIGLLSVGMWLQRDRLIMRAEAARLSEQAKGLRVELQGMSDKLAASAADIARLKSAIESATQDAEAKARAQLDNQERQIGDMKGLLAASEKKADDLADRLAVAEGKVRLAELSRADAERSAADDLRMAREVERRRSMQVIEHERDMMRAKEALGRKIEEAAAAELAARMAAKKLAEEKAELERQIEAAKASDGDTSQLAKEKAAVERKIEEVQAMAADTSRLNRRQAALQKKLDETGGGRDVERGPRTGARGNRREPRRRRPRAHGRVCP